MQRGSYDSIACPMCGASVTIAGPGLGASATMDAADFIALPFAVSSTAHWRCAFHGDVGRVTVAVIDDRVSYVPPHVDP